MSRTDADGLVAALIAKTKEIAATEHVGRINRLFKQKMQIFDALESLPNGAALLAGLLDDPDPNIRLDIAQHCRAKKINAAVATNVLRKLADQSDKLGFDARMSLNVQPVEMRERQEPVSRCLFPFLPAPSACDGRAAEGMIAAGFVPERARNVIGLLQAAIRIWPTPPSGSPIESRLGGLPAVPPGWSWPFTDEEPMLFLAQINCGELGALAKKFNLPSRGLISFFGDHDDVNGCEPAGGGAVYYFEEPALLAMAPAPIDDFTLLITCGVSFYETTELPDPMSDAVDSLQLSEIERDAYYDLHEAISQFGFAERPGVMDDEISKLFGWPDLVQDDIFSEDANRLLLQIGWYRDGTEIEAWGPGGTVYFRIRPEDLAQWRFDCAELDMQCT